MTLTAAGTVTFMGTWTVIVGFNKEKVAVRTLGVAEVFPTVSIVGEIIEKVLVSAVGETSVPIDTDRV